MNCYSGKLEVLGPVYELVSRGLSDREIASKLNLTEVTVHGCISWLSNSLKCETREELVLYASPRTSSDAGLHAA